MSLRLLEQGLYSYTQTARSMQEKLMNGEGSGYGNQYGITHEHALLVSKE